MSLVKRRPWFGRRGRPLEIRSPIQHSLDVKVGIRETLYFYLSNWHNESDPKDFEEIT